MRLLEREHELATLEAALMEGGVVIVEGGAGIGKTSLLAAVALRPSRPADEPPPLAAIRAEASVVRPRLLSEAGAADLVRSAAGNEVSVEACAALWHASGGNPFYLIELARGAESSASPVEIVRDGVTRHVAARI